MPPSLLPALRAHAAVRRALQTCPHAREQYELATCDCCAGQLLDSGHMHCARASKQGNDQPSMRFPHPPNRLPAHVLQGLPPPLPLCVECVLPLRVPLLRRSRSIASSNAGVKSGERLLLRVECRLESACSGTLASRPAWRGGGGGGEY